MRSASRRLDGRSIATLEAVESEIRQAMNESAFLHVGVTVPDLDSAVAFYVKVLGFRPAPARFTSSGPQAAQLSGYAARGDEDPTHEVAFLRKGGFFLELVTFRTGEPGPERIPMKHYGFQHLALSVLDVDATLALAEEHGGQRVPERRIQLALGDDAASITIAFCADPAGNLIELVGHPDQAAADLQSAALGLKELGWASDRPSVG